MQTRTDLYLILRLDCFFGLFMRLYNGNDKSIYEEHLYPNVSIEHNIKSSFPIQVHVLVISITRPSRQHTFSLRTQDPRPINLSSCSASYPQERTTQLFVNLTLMDTSDATYVDVLVVGAGPAGLMAATALAKGGVNVKIVDQKYALFFSIRSTYRS